MDIKQLRIGNIIQSIKRKSPWIILSFYGNTEVLVDTASVSFPTDDECSMGLIHFEAAPINEQWLLRFGFIKTKQDVFILPRFGYFLSVDPNNNYSWEFSTGILHSNESFEKEKYPLVWIESVHQLQNLVFALSENELVLSGAENFKN